MKTILLVVLLAIGLYAGDSFSVSSNGITSLTRFTSDSKVYIMSSRRLSKIIMSGNLSRKTSELKLIEYTSDELWYTYKVINSRKVFDMFYSNDIVFYHSRSAYGYDFVSTTNTKTFLINIRMFSKE